MVKQISSSAEWQMPLLALVGNSLDGKARALALVPNNETAASESESNAHLLICPAHILASPTVSVHPYQFYDFQAHYKTGLLHLAQASALHYTDWENWNDILSFLSVHDYLQDQRQTLFFYRLLLSYAPLNVFVPLGHLTYQIVQLTKQKSVRKISQLDITLLIENSCS